MHGGYACFRRILPVPCNCAYWTCSSRTDYVTGIEEGDDHEIYFESFNSVKYNLTMSYISRSTIHHCGHWVEAQIFKPTIDPSQHCIPGNVSGVSTS